MVVEDERAVRDMLGITLNQAGFEYVMAEDVNEANKKLGELIPDIILLDWMLPDVTGLQFAKKLKKNALFSAIPIIMLTAKSEENCRVAGLEAGVDDYVVKPFSTRELVARINAVLRRSQKQSAELIDIEGIKFDLKEYRLFINDLLVNIGPTELKLLHFFIDHKERVFSRTQLLDYVWGRDSFIEERTVDVHIRRLRKVLAEHHKAHLIQTVRGVGYRFSSKVGVL